MTMEKLLKRIQTDVGNRAIKTLMDYIKNEPEELIKALTSIDNDFKNMNHDPVKEAALEILETLRMVHVQYDWDLYDSDAYEYVDFNETRELLDAFPVIDVPLVLREALEFNEKYTFSETKHIVNLFYYYVRLYERDIKTKDIDVFITRVKEIPLSEEDKYETTSLLEIIEDRRIV